MVKFAVDLAARQVGGSLDLSGFFSKKFVKKFEKKLVQAGMESSASEYVSFAVVFSLFATGTVFILLLALNAPAEALLASPLVLAVFFALSCNYPFSSAHRRAALVERDLAVALRTIAVELSVGIPFERALKTIAKTGHGELSREMKRVVADIEVGGAGVGEALKAFGQRIDSLLAKRAAMQLAFTYEQGLGGEGLRKLADELSALQKNSAREYSAKMAFFGLLFVAVSCVLPALFSAYVIVGSSFMELLFTPAQVALAFVFLFPAADLAILYFLKKKTPAVLGF